MVATLDGLNALLEKNPIIPTYKARDLLQLPETVEAAYEHHVRSYVPLSRGVNQDESANLDTFERRLSQLVREARVPIGYVAAEYGHGKTSTGLFLWERARARNILAVPPFSLDRLEDVITAVAGWVRFMVERMRPGLGERAVDTYERYRSEGVEALARRHAEEFSRAYEDVLVEFRRLNALEKLQTNADGLTYVNFLGEMTDLAKEAGFDGLVVVADELQQYIEHADVSSAAEPIGRLFDLITTMLSRTGRLACGLIFLLPNKELGLLNQQRGDLVQRIKANRLALDLTQLYAPTFAAELWDRLAETLHFDEIKGRVITADALRALGEIAARTDLASGPRTVVDVLKIACQRFQESAEAPYDVQDLIGAFEQGQIAFDGLSRIQGAVRQALAHELVRGKPGAERAVRLMAAFPTTGLSVELQERAGVLSAVDDLTRLTGGELVAIRGGGFDYTGRAIDAGVTLIALRPAQEQVTWLKSTIREFRRGYFLGSEAVHRLAAQAFRMLLTGRLFPAPHWKVEHEYESTPLSQNQGLLLRGAFPSAVRRFPERTVYVCILRPEESLHAPLAPHDLLIDVTLLVQPGSDANPSEQSSGALRWLALNHAHVELNLLHRAADATYLDLSPGFEDIVAPYDVNPLLTLSLHAHLARLLEMGAVPGAEESNVRDLFLPALHMAALRDLLYAGLGRTAQPPITAADTRFFEDLVLRLCERTYGDGYVTLMATPQWRNALDQYRGALQRIDNPFTQNGNEPFEGTKRQLAELFTRTNTGLDNFIDMFPHLMKIEVPFRGDREGRVRFTLHPLEQRIVQLIQAGDKVQRLHPRTHQVAAVPVASVAEVNAKLAAVGYRMGEVDAGLQLLEARRMIESDPRTGTVALTEPDIPPLDVIQSAALALDQRFKTVRAALSETAVRMLEGKLGTLVRAVQNPERTLRGVELLRAHRAIMQLSGELEQEIQQQRRTLAQYIAQIRAQPLVDPTISVALTQPLDDALFGGQLNAVRLRLQEEARTLAQQGEAIHSAVQEVLSLLSKSSTTDADLVQANAAVRKALTAFQSLTQRREQLQRRLGDYRIAAQLIADARGLLTDKLAPLGDPAAEQRSAFDEWTRWVTGELAEGRDGALERTGAWQERLGAIKQDINAHEQALRSAFAARQETLRAILIDHLQRRADLLPPPLAFNPADPEESECLLVERTRAALDDARDRLLSQVQNIVSIARDQSRPEKLISLPAARREQASEDMQAIQPQAEVLTARAVAEFSALRSAIGEAGLDELVRHAQAIIGLALPVAALFSRVQALTRELQSVALTPEEMRAKEALQEAAGDGSADLASFEQGLRRELPNADAWAMLQALVRKSRARVQIELIGD